MMKIIDTRLTREELFELYCPNHGVLKEYKKTTLGSFIHVKYINGRPNYFNIYSCPKRRFFGLLGCSSLLSFVPVKEDKTK